MSDGSSSAISSVTDAQRDSLAQKIQFALMAKQLSAVRQQGQAAVELVQAAAQLVSEPGKGENLDVQG